jgi:hypothetical protein
MVEVAALLLQIPLIWLVELLPGAASWCIGSRTCDIEALDGCII